MISSRAAPSASTSPPARSIFPQGARWPPRRVVQEETLGLDPFCGATFAFRSRRADRIKVLVWDQTGLVLAHKRLEGGTFARPTIADGVMRLTPAQVSALFEGLDGRRVRAERRTPPRSAG